MTLMFSYFSCSDCFDPGLSSQQRPFCQRSWSSCQPGEAESVRSQNARPGYKNSIIVPGLVLSWCETSLLCQGWYLVDMKRHNCVRVGIQLIWNLLTWQKRYYSQNVHCVCKVWYKVNFTFCLRRRAALLAAPSCWLFGCFGQWQLRESTSSPFGKAHRWSLDSWIAVIFTLHYGPMERMSFFGQLGRFFFRGPAVGRGPVAVQRGQDFAAVILSALFAVNSKRNDKFVNFDLFLRCLPWWFLSDPLSGSQPSQIGARRLPRQQLADFRTRYAVRSKYTLAAHLHFSGGLAWTAALDLSDKAFKDVPVDGWRHKVTLSFQFRHCLWSQKGCSRTPCRIMLGAIGFKHKFK